MTAVDFIFEQIYIEPKDKAKWDAILIIAKEMEKQQIVNAYESAICEEYSSPETGVDYYNQTYKTENE